MIFWRLVTLNLQKKWGIIILGADLGFKPSIKDFQNQYQIKANIPSNILLVTTSVQVFAHYRSAGGANDNDYQQ